MERSPRIAALVGAFVLGTLLTSVLLVLAGAVIWQTVELDDRASELPDTLEGFLDQQIDAGFADPTLDENDPLLRERKIFLGHDINARSAKDVATRLFLLDGIDHDAPIDLYISTQGGWGDNAFTIIDAMRLIDAPVNTWAVGGCYSSGAMILAAGTGRRRATENAILMVHANLDDSSEEYSFDRLARARYENLWRQTARLPESWFPMTADESYYLSAQEALELGLIDEIVPVWSDPR